MFNTTRTLTSFTADDLQTGGYYKFKISAFNYNGQGPLSDELAVYACVAPSKMQMPQRVSSTDTSLVLSWMAPSDDGGCPILGYAVFINDGLGGPITTEVNSAIDTNVRDLPSLRQLEITNFPADSAGLVFAFQVQAFNIELSSIS